MRDWLQGGEGLASSRAHGPPHGSNRPSPLNPDFKMTDKVPALFYSSLCSEQCLAFNPATFSGHFSPACTAVLYSQLLMILWDRNYIRGFIYTGKDSPTFPRTEYLALPFWPP